MSDTVRDATRQPTTGDCDVPICFGVQDKSTQRIDSHRLWSLITHRRVSSVEISEIAQIFRPEQPPNANTKVEVLVLAIPQVSITISWDD